MSSHAMEEGAVYAACKLCQSFVYKGQHAENEANKSAMIAKILGIILTLVSALLGIYLRLKGQVFTYSAISSYISVLTGGMFVSMALFYLLPSAIVEMPSGVYGSIPWIFVSCIAGFIAVLLNERVIFNTSTVEVIDETVVEDLELEVPDPEKKGEKGGEFTDAPEESAAQGNGWGVLVLSLAMCVPSIFEGAIVTTANTASGVWLATMMVSLHRLSSGFSIASRMEDQKLRRLVTWPLLGLFTLSTPIGAAIGWILGAFTTGTDVIPLFNSFAAGTLLYFGFAEIVAEEFQQSKGRYPRFVTFLIGIVIVALLTWLHNDLEQDLSADHSFLNFCKVSHNRCKENFGITVDENTNTPALPVVKVPALEAPEKDASEDHKTADIEKIKEMLDKLKPNEKKAGTTLPSTPNSLLSEANEARAVTESAEKMISTVVEKTPEPDS